MPTSPIILTPAIYIYVSVAVTTRRKTTKWAWCRFKSTAFTVPPGPTPTSHFRCWERYVSISGFSSTSTALTCI